MRVTEAEYGAASNVVGSELSSGAEPEEVEAVTIAVAMAMREQRAAGRAEGVREAIATLSLRFRSGRGNAETYQCMADVSALLTAPPPPAATCNADHGFACEGHGCPVHAPKPAAEPIAPVAGGGSAYREMMRRISARTSESSPEPARKAVCGICGGSGRSHDAAGYPQACPSGCAPR